MDSDYVLYRGKPISGGDYIYGNLLKLEIDNDIRYFINENKINTISKYSSDSYYYVNITCIEVDLDTVGQYIGSDDTNNIKCFENDYVEIDGCIEKVEREFTGFYPFIDYYQSEDMPKFVIEKDYEECNYEDDDECY